MRGKKGEFWFRVGTVFEKTANLVKLAFQHAQKIKIRDTFFDVNGIKIDYPGRELIEPIALVTLSPILLYNRDNRRKCILVDDTDFPKYVQDAINHQIKNARGSDGTVSVLRIEAQGVRKRTIKERTVLANKCRLWLEGSSEDLKHVVDSGIGNSPGLGFGMVIPTGGRIK